MAQKTRAQLEAQIVATIFDNATGAIDATAHNQLLQDILDSVVISDPDESVPAGDYPEITVVSETDIVTGARWYGRTSMKELSDGTWVMIYREADFHYVNLDAELVIRFSDDYGDTWTAKNTKIGGGAVTGFPMYPANATPTDDEGPGEPWLMIAPNGDLLLHMWSVDYGVLNQGTYQSRSTDGGKTWSAPALITWVNNTGISISGNEHIFSTDDDFVHDGVIYAGAREYQSATTSSTAIRSWLVKSEDNGTTWELVSKLSEYSDVTNEFGFEYVGDDTIVALVRGYTGPEAYYAKSTDMGLTWSALTEIQSTMGIVSRNRIKTRSHVKMTKRWWLDPVLLVCGFVHVEGGNSHPRRLCVWASKDGGDNFIGPMYLRFAGYDGGYGDFLYNPVKDEYVNTVYFAPITDTTLEDGIVKQFNFTIDWNVSSIFESDTFDGAVIDTAKWTVIDPADGVSIQQNNELQFVVSGVVASSAANVVQSIKKIAYGDTMFTAGGTLATSASGSLWQVRLYSDLGRYAQIFRDIANDNIVARVYDGSSFVYSVTPGLSAKNRFKIRIDKLNNISFWYWNVSQWTQIGVTHNEYLGNEFYLEIGQAGGSADTGGNYGSFDDVYMTKFFTDLETPI